MGIFNFSKKNNSGVTQKPLGINLKNPIIKQMVDWIEHPLEFNKKPDEIEIVDERNIFWLSQEVEKCYLLRYKVNNEEYIGFTGPITWTFLEIDFNKLSIDDLYLRYVGWYTVFATVNSENYDKSLEGSNQEKLVKKLTKQECSDITILEVSCLGGRNYYELSCTKNEKQIKMVGTEDNLKEYDVSHILPYYEFIGLQWGPFEYMSKS